VVTIALVLTAVIERVRSHGAGRRTVPDDSRGISAVNRFELMV
jgi:hypothetical protein